MDSINIKTLRGVLIPIANDVRAKLNTPHLPTLAEAHFSAMLKVVSIVLMFLEDTEKQKGESDMKKLSDSLSVEIIKISDIPHTKKESHWQPLVLEEAKALKQGEAKVIDPKVITYGHLNSIVAKLKKDKELDDSIKLIKRGEKYFLAKV